MNNTISKNPFIPVLCVDKVVDTLSDIFTSAVASGTPFKKIPSVMLWGAPGVGKSQAIRQVASRLEANTGKKCVVTDVRLLLFNPIDLRGIPTANADKTLAIWLKPQIFQMNPDKGVINLLFLDEISAAPQSVQAAAYQITLDRIIGEHKLPDNCIVIAAGNRVTDKSVSFKMPRALANRLCHLEVESNFDSWHRWAISAGLSPIVTGFLSFRRNYLIENESESESLAFPTPRSWEMVSNLLNMSGQNLTAIYDLVCGCIGTGVASELRTWCRVFKALPSIDDIFRGKCSSVPKQTDELYALVASMVAYAKDHKDNTALIENSLSYSLLLPPDFSVVLVTGYMAIDEGYRNKLLTMPAFKKWISLRGKSLNGIR